MIKIGIIGCGKIAELRHAPEYAENESAKIIAYFDPAPGRAQSLADMYGGEVCDSVESLIESGVDAVSVCTANATHAEIAIQALEAGKHVLCEKPMATTLSDCEAMNEAARKSGKFLMIGHNQRFSKAHAGAKELIARGEIGKVLSFRTTFGHPGPEVWTGQKNSWFFDKKISAFGAMADLGIHKTDLLHFLTGDVITRVEAQLATLDKRYPDGSPISVDDNAFCIYRLRGGAVGTLHVSWTFYGAEDNSTVIYGSEGKLYCYANPKYALMMENADGERIHYTLDALASNADQNAGKRISTGVIDAFIDSIRTNTPPAVSGEEAIKAMRVIFAAQESAEKGCAVEVEQG